jgi:hypothetical protein
MPADSIGQGEDVRNELQTAFQARRELGPEYEPAIVDGFLERIDARLAARVNELVDERQKSSDNSSGQLAVAIASLIAAVPLSAIASDSGIFALLALWTLIAVLNLAYALGRRHR